MIIPRDEVGATMDYTRYWLSRPYQVERYISYWFDQYPHLVDIEHVRQYVGLNAYAITVTDREVSNDRKEKLLFAVPHAHEPAGTVACMDFINLLLTGQRLDGSKSDIDREAILKNFVLSFIPDANPDGRSRAPVDFWDGTKYSNEELWAFAFGKDPTTKKMWKRPGRWSTRYEMPGSVGIAYEQINEHEYVEPNRDFASAYYRLIKMIGGKYGYGYWLDLHQTEFEKSEHNAMVILPIVQNELPGEIQSSNLKWADKVLQSWKAIGANPIPKATPLSYTGEQAEYFRRAWREFIPIIPYITTEVQNNNPRTPPQMQAVLQFTAIKATIEMLMRDSN